MSINSISQHLFHIAYLCKSYPLRRGFYVGCPIKTGLPRNDRRAVAIVMARLVELGKLMNDMKKIWDERWQPVRDWPGLMSVTHRYMIDTFPTYVNRPEKYWSRFHNPKYGGCVVKVRILLVLATK
jgi:hypothetical protein